MTSFQTSPWPPPALLPPGAREVRCVEAHTEGEPLRIVLSGFEGLQGATILERRRDARARFDDLRRALMWEPRGHADMYGCIVVPREREDSHFGVLFTHNEGYSTMCGHGVLAMARVAVELGMVPGVPGERAGMEAAPVAVVMDTPAGQVRASVTPAAPGRPPAVSFTNVPSWVESTDVEVTIPGPGAVRCDVAFGGAYYAFVDAREVGLPLEPAAVPDLVRMGQAIKAAVQALHPPRHPGGADLSFVYGTIFTGPPEEEGHHSRHCCVFADGEVDRSPTGTGVSARLALLRARGEVEPDETLTIESIIGSRFRCRIVEELAPGEGRPREAVVSRVEGRAFVTGFSTFVLDPADPLRHGFLVR